MGEAKTVAAFAVIFDLDGVIVDSNWAHLETIRTLCLRHGLAISEGDLKARVFGRRNCEWIVDVFGDDLDAQDIDRLSDEKEALFRTVFAPRVALLRGLPEFLDLLIDDGVPMAIASSAPAENVDLVLRKTQLAHRFAVVFDATSTGVGKPDPEVFLLAARKLGIPPKKCVVFEDSLSGIEAAKRAGTKVVGVTTTHTLGELAHADIVINDFVGLTMEHLEGLVSGNKNSEEPALVRPGEKTSQQRPNAAHDFEN